MPFTYRPENRRVSTCSAKIFLIFWQGSLETIKLTENYINKKFSFILKNK